MKKLILMVLLASPLYAQTYYVKNGGDDEAAGTSDGTAWASIAKVNAVTLGAGDSVLFNRGDTWEKVMLVLSNKDGTAGSPVYFGAYGSGARPIISVIDTIPGWSVAGNWTDQGSNRWSISFTGTPKRLWFNDVEYPQVGATANIGTHYRWYYASNVIWVYATENPATAYTSIKYPWSGDVQTAISFYNSSYVTIQSIHIKGGKTQLTGFADHVVIDSCTFSDAAGYGIYAVNTSAVCDSGIVRYCTLDYGDTLTHLQEFAQGNEDGIRLMTGNGWQIHNNVFRSWAHSAIEIDVVTGAAYCVNGSRIYQNEFDGQSVDYGRAIAINGVELKMDSCRDNWFYRNYIHHMPTVSQIGGRRSRVFYNWFDSLTSINWKTDWRYSTAVAFVAYPAYAPVTDTVFCDSSIIANNTICLAQGQGISISEEPGGCTADTFANNLIWYPAVSDTTALKGVGLWIPNHTEYAAGYAPGKIVALNNLFYGDSANCVKYRKWWNGYTDYTVDDDVATFNARSDSGDVIDNNVWGDPAFISASNRRLTSGSAARDVGVSMGFTVDYDGNLITGLPDIGAFEYQPSSPVVKKLLKRVYP